jgi:molybdate transport system substrate-binding protein
MKTTAALRPDGSSTLDILSAGAMHAVLEELVPVFERAYGIRTAVQFASSGGVKARVLAGEAVDVAITTQSAMDELRRGGKLPTEAIPFARSAIGVAVRSGASKPDIGSVESFVHVLRNAESIAFADPQTGSPSANHFVDVLDRLGLMTELRPKIRLVRGDAGKVVVVGEVVARGEAEIAIQQVAEILAVPGIDFVGELPAQLQHVTVFCVAVAAAAKDMAAAGRFIDFLASPAAASVINAKGMQAG